MARVLIRLRDIEPCIWRRVDVPVSISLAGLHQVIQATMGWTDSHLHRFEINGRDYGFGFEFEQEDSPRTYKDKNVRLRTLIAHGVRRFPYIYDYGDNWEHDIIIESVREGEEDVEYPAFLEGQRRCPPEDVGGAQGFQGFLHIVARPRHPEHQKWVTWYGRRFDPEDIEDHRIQMMLGQMARQRRGRKRRT